MLLVAQIEKELNNLVLNTSTQDTKLEMEKYINVEIEYVAIKQGQVELS